MSRVLPLPVTRAPRPETRIDLIVAGGTTVVALLLYVGALFQAFVPPDSFAPVLYTAAPVFAFASLPLFATRAYKHRDEAVNWFGIGVFGAMVALSFQLFALPFVWANGGPLGTDNDSSAALYLLAHACLVIGTTCGALNAPPRLRGWVLLGELVVATALALNAIPLPTLLRADSTYSAPLTAAEVVLLALTLGAAFLWTRRTGRSADITRGLIGLAVVLSAIDLTFNALGGARFDPVWWTSLTVRVLTYGLLACGGAVVMARQLRRLDSYTDRELDRTETELRQSLEVNVALLDNAQTLTNALSPADVAEAAIVTCLRVTGLPRAVVLLVDPASGRLEVLASEGYDAESVAQLSRATIASDLPSSAAIRHGEPLYAANPRELNAFAGVIDIPLERDSGCVAALPLRGNAGVLGVMKVAGPDPRAWTGPEREILAGVASQVEESLERSLLYERARDAATSLQRSLLPPALPAVAGVRLAARYVPGSTGLTVGGDWYDVVETDDGRIALLVGDVMGKGTAAAAQMGQLRTALRAFISVDPDPTSVVARLDASTTLAPDHIVTFAYLLLDPRTGQVDIARVGHLPFIVYNDGDDGTVVDAGGSLPLGVPGVERVHERIELPEWSTILMFTDGLVERRGSGLGDDIDALRASGAAILRSTSDVDELADRLLEARGSAEAEDDLCLLVISRDS